MKTLKTDMQVKAAVLPVGKKQLKLSVGDGLYLLIKKAGKYWRYDFVYDGKRATAALGVYPKVSMKQAKSKAQDAKNLLAEGINPNKAKRQALQANVEATRKKQIETESDANTFKKIGREWFDTIESGWSDSHASKQMCRLNKHLFPAIGHIPITELTRIEITETLKSIHSPDIARRVSQMCKSILNFACNSGLIEAVPMGDMSKVLPAVVSTKMPAITEPKRIGELLRATHAYQGHFVVAQALKLLPHLAVRAGEFRTAEWVEFDLDNAIWTIPAAHRKLKKVAKANLTNVHLVPLSTQAVAILREIQCLTGRGKHVFPSVRGDSRPMSDGTINSAIAAVGFKGQMVGHGWRAAFSTTLNERNFNADAIERQLAHGEPNKVRDAYNRADYLTERTTMMQAWSNYLDALRDGANVVPINRKA